MTKYTLHDIHIDPEKTWLMDFDEYYGGKKTYSKYLIEPYGPYQHNELLDTVYVDPNHEMCYHEHTRGVETFLVDGGSVLTEICGKKAVCTKGDIVHISAYTPHKFTWIDAGTIWRELFQETQMGEDCIANLRFKEYNKTEFDMAKDGQSTDSLYYTYTPVTEAGFQLSWSAQNPFYSLFIVQEGSVEVRIDGMEKFTAKERDVLHIPTHLSGEITAPDGAVLFDYNCEGFGLRAIEELYSLYAADPEKAEAEAENILSKHKCYVRGRLIK